MLGNHHQRKPFTFQRKARQNRRLLSKSIFFYIYIYKHVRVCVCRCVCVIQSLDVAIFKSNKNADEAKYRCWCLNELWQLNPEAFELVQLSESGEIQTLEGVRKISENSSQINPNNTFFARFPSGKTVNWN